MRIFTSHQLSMFTEVFFIRHIEKSSGSLPKSQYKPTIWLDYHLSIARSVKSLARCAYIHARQGWCFQGSTREEDSGYTFQNSSWRYTVFCGFCLVTGLLKSASIIFNWMRYYSPPQSTRTIRHVFACHVQRRVVSALLSVNVERPDDWSELRGDECEQRRTEFEALRKAILTYSQTVLDDCCRQL